MEKFKDIIMPMHGHSKSKLYYLYMDSEARYSHNGLEFWFEGTGVRNQEKLTLFVAFCIPRTDSDSLPVENYLLHVLSPMINKLSREYQNRDKDSREKAQFAAQAVNENILRRSGITHSREQNQYILRLNFQVPLVNALSVNAKSTIRAVKDLLNHIRETVDTLDYAELEQYVSVYRRQTAIRTYLRDHGLCAFIADGSILPRENGTNQPKRNAVPFVSPENMRITIPLEDGSSISGMAVRQGITVITGGGYSGKSTLLDAIETGIYNHIPGDGREYCITDNTALKIYAEDGRPVTNVNLSPFFRHLPDSEVGAFTTTHASGSVSQAANIVEAVCAGSRLLLIDEDKSATNFMIRDKNMRKIVKNEPIIPFTDRVRELYSEKGVSTILVIGGSSEYLSYSDTVLLMDEYRIHNITTDVGEMELEPIRTDNRKAYWMECRRVLPKESTLPFLFFRTVETENERKIILDDGSSKTTADITLLTALTSGGQLNTLAYMMEKLLSDKEADSEELAVKLRAILERVFCRESVNIESLVIGLSQRWYEEIRVIDAFCCVNRMRGNIQMKNE